MYYNNISFVGGTFFSGFSRPGLIPELIENFCFKDRIVRKIYIVVRCLRSAVVQYIWSPFVMLTFVFLGRNSRARFISRTSAPYLCDMRLEFSDALVYTKVTRLRSFSHRVQP